MGWFKEYEDEEMILYVCDVCMNPEHNMIVYKKERDIQDVV